MLFGMLLVSDLHSRYLMKAQAMPDMTVRWTQREFRSPGRLPLASSQWEAATLRSAGLLHPLEATAMGSTIGRTFAA